MKNFLYAIATLIGTIIGVGLFGIPYVVARSGFLIGLGWLIIIGAVALIIHLAYGEIILRTKGKHRRIGYVDRYLGKRETEISALIILLARFGALLAYIIVAGQFLFILFDGILDINPFAWSVIFFIFGSLLIFFGLKVVAKVEIIMTVFLILIVGILLGKGLGSINPENLVTLNISSFFLPYGVIFFSLGGLTAIPEMRGMLRGREKLLKKSIILGTLVPIIIFILFTFLIVGVTGIETSEEAITGLGIALKNGAVNFGAFFGLLAVATSFLVLGLNLKETFLYDYKLSHKFSWALSCFIPFILFLIGLRNFIEVIGFVGAIFGGLEGIILILIYQRAKKDGKREPEYSLSLPLFVRYGIISMFVLGIIYQIVYHFTF